MLVNQRCHKSNIVFISHISILKSVLPHPESEAMNTLLSFFHHNDYIKISKFTKII